MIDLIRYTADKAQQWDNFVEDSRNGTFLFLRPYMDYHSDRFHDHSLMYYKKEKLIAVMPANEIRHQKMDTKSLYSHQGLTYGGLVLANSIHAAEIGEIFYETIAYLRDNDFTEWHYKPVPKIFHKYPSQEDEYWLWRIGAQQEMCNLSCTVDLQAGINNVGHSRKNNYNKILRQGYTIDSDCDMADFWPILEENLMSTYDAHPVHTLHEIQQLKSAFPNNIICRVARNAQGEIEAGTILYLMNDVVHTQYISASQTGKKTKAVDFLILSLLQEYKEKETYHYFDFGTSNEEGGKILNESLILQKEGFGGRGVVYNGYKITI